MLSTHQEQEVLNSVFWGGHPNIEIEWRTKILISNQKREEENPGKHSFASMPQSAEVMCEKNVRTTRNAISLY